MTLNKAIAHQLSTVYGAAFGDFKKLQLVWNVAACMLMGASKFEHITAVLQGLC